MSQIERIIERIKSSGLKVSKRPKGYMTCCPAHQDKTPSLSVKEADNGKVLVHCFGGCKPRDVMAAIGLELKDLFADSLSPEERLKYEREKLEDRRNYLEILLSIAGNPQVQLSTDDLETAAAAKEEFDKISETLSPQLLTEEYFGDFDGLPSETVPADYCGGWFRERSYSIIHSRAGAGKTATIADLVYSLSTGDKWLGMPTTRPERPILWVNGDMPRWQVKERLGYLQGRCKLWHIRFDNLLKRPGFVRDACKQFSVVVFDNRGCLFDLEDANSAEAWKALNDLMRQIADSGCAVILVTHGGKGESASAFGSSAQEWFTDSVIAISSKQDKESGTVTQTISWDKCRLSAVPAKTDYHLDMQGNRLRCVLGSDTVVKETFESVQHLARKAHNYRDKDAY